MRRPEARAFCGASSRPTTVGAAFTLVELLVVIVIIATVASVAIPYFKSRQEQSRISSLRGSLASLRNAVDRFYADTGFYPEHLDYLTQEPAEFDADAVNGVTPSGAVGKVPNGRFKGPYVHKPTNGVWGNVNTWNGGSNAPARWNFRDPVTNLQFYYRVSGGRYVIRSNTTNLTLQSL